MSTPASGLSIAQQMLNDGSLPDMPDTGVPMRAVVAAASATNPDSEARAQQLAQQSGMGVDLVRNDPAAAQQRAVTSDLDRRELEVTNPILASQLRDPNFAGIAHDQLDNLSATEKIFNWVKRQSPITLSTVGGVVPQIGIAPDVANQYEAGHLSYEKGLLGNKAQEGRATADDWGRIDEISRRLREIGAPESVAGGVSNLAGTMAPQGPFVLAAGAAGGILGGAAGLLGGPLAPVSVPAGAAEGFSAGTTAAMGERGYTMMAGNAYLDMLNRGVSHDTAKWAAAGAGLVGGALQVGGAKIVAAMPGVQTLSSAATEAISKAAGMEIADAMTQPTVSTAVKSALGRMLASSAGGGVMMGGQELANQLALNVAEMHDLGKFDLETDEGRANAGRAIGQAFVNGAVTIGALHAATGVVGFGVDMARANDAQRAQQFFATLTDNAAESKVRERNPNAYENFIAAQANGTGAENVYIDGQRMAEVLHQSGLDPERVDETLPGVREQVEEAARTGGDVAIPTAQYAAKLAGTDLGKAMLPHMRLDPDAMSATEAAEFTANQQTILAEAQARATQEMAGNEAFARSARVVESDVFDQLKATKTMPDDVARVNAQFMRDLVVTQAADLGVTPEEFYQKYKPSIEREGAGPQSMPSKMSSARLNQEVPDLNQPPSGAESQPAKNTPMAVARQLVGYGDPQRDKQSEAFASNGQIETALKQAELPSGKKTDTFKAVKAEIQRIGTERATRYEAARTGTAEYKTAAADARESYGEEWGQMSAEQQREAVEAEYARAMADAEDEDLRARRARDLEDEQDRRISYMDQKQAEVEDLLQKAGVSYSTKGTSVYSRYLSLRLPGDEQRTIRVSDHEPPVDERGRVVGGFSEATGERHDAADVSLHPGDDDIVKVKAALPSIERASGDTMPDVSLKQGAGDKSTQPNEGTPAGAMFDKRGNLQGDAVSRLAAHVDRGDYAYYGLRMDHPVDGPVPGIGETLPPSFVYDPDTGGVTSDRMEGTSAVGIDLDRAESAEQAIVRASKELHRYSAGDDSRVLLIGGEHRNFGEDPGEFVMADPEVIDSLGYKPSDTSSAPAKGAGILHQPARGGFDPSRLAVLLNDKADFTTFAHETAHWYLTVIGDLAKQADAPGRFKNDMGTLLNWFGVKDHATWDAMSLEEQRKFHEQFAYSFEKYLAEGKAPSLALQGVFDRFKFWMMRVYTSVKDNVNTLYRKEHGADLPMMSGEVRGVMDRMLASDEQIRHAQTVRGLEPLFTSKEMALKSGMSEGDWEEYRNHVAGARDAASAELGASSLRNMQWLSNAKSRVIKEMQAQHDALRAATRAEVEKEVQGEDLYRAQRWLKTGEMETPEGETVAAEKGYKLNASDVKAMFAGKPGAPDLTKLRGMMGPDGMHPDLAAPMFGFDNGEQLVRNLADARPMREEVDARTDQRMLERHGDMNSAEELDRRTNEALHNDARARMLATELKFVQRLQQPVRVLQEAARNVAQRILAEKRIGDISEHDYISGEAKAERAAQAAMRRGDDAGVAKAVQDRLVQNALAKEAIRVREAVDQKLKFLSKFDNPSKAITQKIGADYMDRINELLSGYELSRRAALGGDERPLSQWVNDEYSKTGVMPAVSDDLIVDLGTMHWKDMTVAQLGALHDAVVSLDYIGRRRTEVELEGKAVQVDELIQQVKERMAGVKHTEPVDIRADLAHAKGLDKVQAKFLQLKGKLRSLDAAMLKMEQFGQWLDAGKDAGLKEAPVDAPFARLFRLASNAEGKKRAMQAGSAAALRQLGENLRDAKIDLNEKLDVPELPRANGSTKMYREELLAVALNLGNESNREKLFAGYQWSDERVLSAVNRLLSKPEMDFVQGVWDHIGSYGSGIVELQRRQTGVTPEMIKPAAVVTQHGVYPGGYYPVEYDNFADRSIEEKQARRADQLFENNYANPATNKGHTIARTGYKGPIYLSLGVIARHIDQVTHDLAWREAITDMNKVLTDPRLQREVEETYGREYAKQFRPWLQAMANDRVFNTSGDSAWESLVRKARTNATMVGVGYRLSTMLVHGTSALSNSIGEVGAKWFAKGVQQFMGIDRVQDARDFVYARSPEMAHRMDAVDRNITEAINEINTREGSLTAPGVGTQIFDKARRFAMYGVSMLDMASAMPTWLGAYLKGMAKEADGGLNLPEADAIEYANRAVRNAHGGGGTKDLAAIQRDKGVMSLATMFYSFWNHMYNRQRDMAKGWGAVTTGQGSTNNLPRLMARSFFYFVVPQLAHAMLKPSARKEEEAGDLAGWSKTMGEDIALGLVSGVPILRDMANAAVNGRDYTVTPLEQAGKSIVTTFQNVGHLAKGEPTGKRAFENAAQTAGYVFGIPTAQPAATTKFLWDVMNGDADPQTMKDWWQGVLTGHLR